MDKEEQPNETSSAPEATAAQASAAQPPEDAVQDRPDRPGLGERVFRLRSVMALSLAGLILGGVGGAALGAVSAGSDSDPGGRIGGPPDGQLGQPGQQGP